MPFFGETYPGLLILKDFLNRERRMRKGAGRKARGRQLSLRSEDGGFVSALPLTARKQLSPEPQSSPL